MSFKILFMGTPDFAVPILEAINNSDNKILEIYTQPAKKMNRGHKIHNSPVYNCAKKLNLQVRCPITLANSDELDHIKKLSPDVVVVVAYGQILPVDFLNLEKIKFLNVHASLLPKWRGAAPIQRSIMNLDNQTGISIMKIVEELDAGPVMHQDKIKINENIDALSLSKVLSKLGAKSVISAINKIENGKAQFQDQNHHEATYAKKISKLEGKINWNQSAKKVLAKINGLNPNPGAWFEFKNERFKVWKAEIINKSGDVGKTLDNKLAVACKEQSIKILEIQKEGKNRQLTNQFLLGNKIIEGENLN